MATISEHANIVHKREVIGVGVYNSLHSSRAGNGPTLIIYRALRCRVYVSDESKAAKRRTRDGRDFFATFVRKEL